MLAVNDIAVTMGASSPRSMGSGCRRRTTAWWRCWANGAGRRRCCAPSPGCSGCTAARSRAAASPSTANASTAGHHAHRAARHRAGIGGPATLCRTLCGREPAYGAISVRDGVAVRRAYERVMEFPVLRERHTSMAGTSGGEQQMVAIGRAVMAMPRLLVLDEPSLGLAPFLVGQIRDIIAEIGRGGTAVCWSSRTRRWRSQSRHMATYWRPGASRWKDRRGSAAR